MSGSVLTREIPCKARHVQYHWGAMGRFLLTWNDLALHVKTAVGKYLG